MCSWDRISDECGEHAMLAGQRMLDGLVYALRVAKRLVADEFGGPDDRT